jgi:protein ImuB
MDEGSMTEPLYVCVYVPEFPAQVRLRLRPELAKLPSVILAGDPPFEEVCSVNAIASRLGVMPGMTRAELDSFTGISVLSRSELEENGARSVLRGAAGMFTPRIEVTPVAAPGFAMVLDMAGTARIFGTVAQALESIQNAFSALQFFTQLAASTNFHTAVCVAPTARKTPVIVLAGQEQEKLSALPLAALPLSTSQAEILELWGLHTIGELAALPEVGLIVRMGQEANRLHLMARGEHPHLMVPEVPAFVLEEYIAFDTSVELLNTLLNALGSMLDQLLIRAMNHAYGLVSLTVKLKLDNDEEYERVIKPALPSIHRNRLLKLLDLDLQLHPPPAGVLSVLMNAEPGDRSKVQLGLFALQLPESLRLEVTLARIASLVGESRVGRARLRHTHRPNSFNMERFLVSEADPSEKKKRKAQCTTALRRYRPPILLSVQTHETSPEAFCLHGKNYIVREAYGPWRRSGDWWSTEVWSNEEWDIYATAQENNVNATTLCVVSHDLLQDCWYLEASYD